MRRPPILRRVINKPRLDWIEVDVPKQLHEVDIVLNELRPIPTLKQMSSHKQPPMPIPRIPHRNPLHDFASRSRAHLHHKMQVIVHPTETVHLSTQLRDHLRHNLIQLFSIIGATEKRLAMISTQRQVIHTTRHMHTRRPRHPCSIRSFNISCGECTCWSRAVNGRLAAGSSTTQCRTCSIALLGAAQSDWQQGKSGTVKGNKASPAP